MINNSIVIKDNTFFDKIPEDNSNVLSDTTCDNIPKENRIDCIGPTGIDKNTCLNNNNCCYDNTAGKKPDGSSYPWCYKKSNSSTKPYRKRTYTAWNNEQCPPQNGKQMVSVPSLPLLQSSQFMDSQHSEFSLSQTCVPRDILQTDEICKNSDGNMDKLSWINVEGVLADSNNNYPKKSTDVAKLEYQILETIPNYIVDSGATELSPGTPTYNMTINEVKNMGPDPQRPYQTHAAFVKELDNCSESFNMCCMYFTFLSYTCPSCNQYMCNTSNLDPETLEKVNFSDGDPTIACKRCMGSEHNVGCCTKTKPTTTFVNGQQITSQIWNPTTDNLQLNANGEPIKSTDYKDPLGIGNNALQKNPVYNKDGTQIQKKYEGTSQNPDPAVCRMGYTSKGAILGFENSNFNCNQEQAAAGCKPLTPEERGACKTDNDCLYGPCDTNTGICDVRPPLNIGEDPLDDAKAYLEDGTMLGTYKVAGVGVYNAIIRAARRGVKMKIVFGWPALANSYLTYISLMKIKWAALDKNGKPAPQNIELIPFNIGQYFQGEINNSSESLMHVVKDCKTGEYKPIFTIQELQEQNKCDKNNKTDPACKSKNNSCYNGKCDTENITKNVFSGAAGISFEPGGYQAVGILHNKLYVWDNKTFYVGAQNATYDASKEMGIMIKNCPAMGEDANRVLNSYIHASCEQFSGRNSKTFAKNAKYNNKLNSEILGSKIATDINMETPLEAIFTPTPRPDNLDGRPSFTSDFKANCFLTNCPASFCKPANRTYDLEALLCAINSSEKFCYLETYDYMEFTKFMACQQSFCGPDPYTQYSPAQNVQWINNPEDPQYQSINPTTNQMYRTLESNHEFGGYKPTGMFQKTGPQVQFLIMRDALYEAAMRGVTVRMIVGQRGVQPCGDNADKIMQLRALEVQTNEDIKRIAKEKNISNPGSIQFKFFSFLCSDTKMACYGAFHCKWFVTEKTCGFSTSNYTGDYFAFTFGSTFVATVPNGLDSVFPMRDDLVNIFVRDWKSSKLIEDIACQCQIMGWPLKTLSAPDMLRHYFLSTPNGGLSSTQVQSVMNILGPQGLNYPITAKQFCSKSCFQQKSGDKPLPISSCYAINTADSILLENSPPIFLGKNSYLNSSGKVVETQKFYPLQKPKPKPLKNNQSNMWLNLLIIFIIVLLLFGFFLFLKKVSKK